MGNNINALIRFKAKFESWSGFSFKSENLDDALKEIKDIQYQLECEISDYASNLEKEIKTILK